MNVLKPHLQTTIMTLLAAGKSQREIARITSVDRKTICSLPQRTTGGVSNSPEVATGSEVQIPPRPPLSLCQRQHVGLAVARYTRRVAGSCGANSANRS